MTVAADFADLKLRRGDKMLGHHFKPGDPKHDDLAWYLVWPKRLSDYTGDLADADDKPQLILYQFASGEIDTKFSTSPSQNEKAFIFLLRHGWEKSDLMRVFKYDGKFDGLADHVADMVKRLQR